MLSLNTGGKFNKFIPIPSLFFATTPIFFKIMKYGITWVIRARIFFLIIFFCKLFITSFINTLIFTLLCYKQFFLLIWIRLNQFLISIFLIFLIRLWWILNFLFILSSNLLTLILENFIWLEKLTLILLSFLNLLIIMSSYFTAWNLFKLLPSVDYFIATCPTFL